MKIVAGIDIGNASTETALARIENGKATFLSSVLPSTDPTEEPHTSATDTLYANGPKEPCRTRRS